MNLLNKLILPVIYITCLSSCDSGPSDADLNAAIESKLFDQSTRGKISKIERGESLVSEGGSIPKNTVIYPVRV